MQIRKYNMGGQAQGQMQGPPQQGPPQQGGPQQPAPVDVNQLLEILSQMPPEVKLSPEEVARFIMGDLPMNIPQGNPMSQGGGMQ